MEFKLTDSHEDVPPGWRLARTEDVESHSELARAELCGMTFNTCSLEDGAVGGPGLGYQITNTVDESLDHKLLITDPLSEGTMVDMKPDLIPPEDSIAGQPDNITKNNESPKTDTQQEARILATVSLPTLDMPEEQKTDYGVETPLKALDDNTETTQNGHISDNNVNISTDTPVADEQSPAKTPDTNTDAAGSGNDSEGAGSPSDSQQKSLASDLESNKSESPSVKKKKAKPMSASLQRLTAKKESPDKRGTELLSGAERKAKADELRKKKIEDQRAKDEERRAAVLERRKKLEAAEREKKEALFKRLTTKENEKAASSRPSPMKGRYSLSTSNLSLLKKNKPVDLNATTVPKTTESTTRPRTSMAERPKSSMQRPSMGYPDKTKSFSADDRKRDEVKRPHTAFGTRSSAAPKPSRPSPRQPLTTQPPPPRPQTSMGLTTEKKKPTLTSRQLHASSERLSTTRKPLSKAKSTSNVNMSATTTTRPASVAGTARPSTASKPKPPRSSTPSGTREKKEPAAKVDSPRKKPEPKKELPVKKELTKEEAKKALAERRKKAKEEAEEKAREEREKDEQERLKREEDEKRLAEQLRMEEERQAALLEQLKKEEEERKVKLMEEKEQKEREEKERLEEEQKLREEEIEKKKQLEMEKIQKEQDRQEELLEQERIERKKRVEMIMARVSSKRTTDDPEASPVSSTPIDTPPVTATPPPEMASGADSARLKVDDILRSRGFGKSTEDISKLLEKREDGNVSMTTTTTTTTTIDGETTTTTTEESVEVATESNQSPNTSVEISTTDVVIDTSATLESNTDINNSSAVPLDENTSIVTPEESPATTQIEITTNGVSSISLEETTADNNVSATTTCNELSDNLEELKLNNDTNNNKDFVVDTAISSPAPLNAWSESNGNGHLTTAGENVDKVNHEVCVNGGGHEEESKVVNGSADLHLTEETVCDDTSSPLQNNEWNKFDEKMKQIQSPTSVENVAPGEEKLWKVLEGKVEMSECY